MPFKIIRNDITKMDVDAIVNAANQSLLGGGGVDGAIHRQAGPKLLEECRKLNGCEVSKAKITKGYNLKAKYIIHTVGPIYKDGFHNEEKLLKACYQNSLNLALKYKVQSIAFPLISSGVYGYPKKEAFKVAIDVINHFLLEHDMLVYLVIYDADTLFISNKLFSDIKEYIDDNYVDEHLILRSSSVLESCHCFGGGIEDIVNNLDESFQEMLFRKIDEKGMSDVECYKKANIDRKLFSKIKKDKFYKPKKTTALAFAIALELSLDETNELLEKAGYILSHSNKFDLIVEYFIKNKNFDIIEINEVLYSFDQSLI